ncbi:hypothetical protein IAU59_006175 [Kwoniella sp. CBS 9459]
MQSGKLREEICLARFEKAKKAIVSNRSYRQRWPELPPVKYGGCIDLAGINTAQASQRIEGTLIQRSSRSNSRGTGFIFKEDSRSRLLTSADRRGSTPNRGYAHDSSQSHEHTVRASTKPERKVLVSRIIPTNPFPSRIDRKGGRKGIAIPRTIAGVLKCQSNRFWLIKGSQFEYNWLEDPTWLPDLTFGQADNGTSLVTTVGRYIDAGDLWDVFEGQLYVPLDTDSSAGLAPLSGPVRPIPVTLKFAWPDNLVCPDYHGFGETRTIRGIRDELRMFTEYLPDLCGREIPRFYGLWEGYHGIYMMIQERLGEPVFESEFAGESVDLWDEDDDDSDMAETSWTHLPLEQRSQIARLYNGIHARGVVHKDIRPWNIRKRLPNPLNLADPNARAATDAQVAEFPWVLTNLDESRRVQRNGPPIRKERRRLGKLLGFPRYWHGWGLPEGAPAW